MKDSPCHYCTERKPSCHSSCREYKDFAEDRERTRELNHQKRVKQAIYSDYKINKMHNMMKGNYRRGKK